MSQFECEITEVGCQCTLRLVIMDFSGASSTSRTLTIILIFITAARFSKSTLLERYFWRTGFERGDVLELACGAG